MSQGTEEQGSGKKQSNRPRGSPWLILCPPAGLLPGLGVSLPPLSTPQLEGSTLQSGCNQCHRLRFKASTSCTGKQKHSCLMQLLRKGGKVGSGKGTPQITSRTREERSHLGTVSLSSSGLTDRSSGS